MIIFSQEGRHGHFGYSPGKALSRVDRLPASDLMPGFRRADPRLATLVRSDRLLDTGEPIICITLGDAGDP